MSITQNNITTNCLLCHSRSNIFYQYDQRVFYQCKTCCGIFLDKKLRLTNIEEIIRYQIHNNNVEDENYQQFVSPITSAVIRDFTQRNKGLDFGAGTGPVISKVLKDNDFKIVQYDPYFHNYPSLLESAYDYIVCCEVIEHFYNPKKEFTLLKKLMVPNSKLYCMTVLFDDTIDFHNWYYKNDPTHVFLYHPNTIYWIKENFEFSNVIIENRLITFSN